MKYADITLGRVEAVWNKLGGEAGVSDFLAGKKVVADPAALTKAKPTSGTIVRVDRSIRPVYPDWMDKVMHPELENTGPKRFDLAKINLWLHEGQNGGSVKGQVIYDHLKATNSLESCLSLRDGEEIKKKGIEAFRKHFGGKAVFLWKSVVQDRNGNLDVPYLYENDGRVVIRWHWLDYSWNDSYPAARFAS